MAIRGTYVNAGANETLTITSYSPPHGTFEGTLVSGGRTLNVKGFYHYRDQSMSITFFTYADNPNLYEAWVGTTVRSDQNTPITLAMKGARSVVSDTEQKVIPLDGPFVRQ